jgi:hypothetical protein
MSLLGHVYNLGLGELFQTFLTLLDADAGLLGAPKGTSSCMSRCLLIQTVPELIFAATAKARPRSFDQTVPPSP